MERLIELNDRLSKIYSNYKKTSRGYKRATIESKVNEADTIKEEYDQTSKNPKLPQQELYELTQKFKATYKKLNDHLIQDLAMPDETNNAGPALSLKDVNNIVPQFNGDSQEVIPFTETIQMVSDTTAENQRAIVAKYIYNNKLTARVRTAIGVAPTNIEELITKLKKRYKSSKSIASIELALQKCQQHKKTVDKFADTITDLITELNLLQVEETPSVSLEAVTSINNTKALRVFINGLNDEIRITTTAARPKTMEEALKIAKEVEMQPSTANVMQFRGRQQHRNKPSQAFSRNNTRREQNQTQRHNNGQPNHQTRQHNNHNRNGQPNNQHNNNANSQTNNRNNGQNQNWQQQNNSRHRPQRNQRRYSQSPRRVGFVQESPETNQENPTAPEEDNQ